jgi:hypothetical protein
VTTISEEGGAQVMGGRQLDQPLLRAEVDELQQQVRLVRQNQGLIMRALGIKQQALS